MLAMPSSSTLMPKQQHPLNDQFVHLSISYHPTLHYVTVVALNRPTKLNAINSQMWKEIGIAFGQLGTMGDGCRCLLLIGNGNGFCGGIDITDTNFFSKMVQSHDGDDNGATTTGGENGRAEDDAVRKSLAFRSQILQMQTAFTSIETFPVPVVAAIHGACIGAGIDLTCCTDVRVCSPTAKFSIREVRLGLAADVGTLQRFPKLVGCTSRVRELCFTGDDFTAQEALSLGFVSRISSTNDSLMDTANDICERICRNSPIAVTITKSSLNYSRDHSVSDGLEHIALHNSTALQSDDLVKSFMSRGGGGGGAPEFSPLHSHARL